MFVYLLFAEFIVHLRWPQGDSKTKPIVKSQEYNDNEIVNYVLFFFIRTFVSKTSVCVATSVFSFLLTIFPNPPPPLLQSSVECLRENLYSLSPQSMGSQLEALVERTEDFTDSAYTSHEQRQAILGLCQLARQDTQQLVHAWVEAVCWHKQARLHRCTYIYRNIHKNVSYHIKNPVVAQ